MPYSFTSLALCPALRHVGPELQGGLSRDSRSRSRLQTSTSTSHFSFLLVLLLRSESMLYDRPPRHPTCTTFVFPTASFTLSNPNLKLNRSKYCIYLHLPNHNLITPFLNIHFSYTYFKFSFFFIPPMIKYIPRHNI